MSTYIHDRGGQLIRIRAWSRGFSARFNGESIESNPYCPGAVCLWESWRVGWEDAG